MDFKKSLLKKIARILIKLNLSALFKIKQKGFYLRFYPTSISRVLWVEQFMRSDSDEEGFFERYIKPGDTVIDAGANIGSVAMLFSVLVGKDGKVYAIEAHPQTFKYLTGNIELNAAENIKLFNVALGNKNGDIQFSNLKSDNRNMVTFGDTGITIPLKRLDELEINTENIALLKIDVEGYEKFVIEGATAILPKVQCIHFEYITNNIIRFGYDPGEILTLLTKYGFTILELQNNKVKIIAHEKYTGSPCDLVAAKNVQAFLARTNYQLH